MTAVALPGLGGAELPGFLAAVGLLQLGEIEGRSPRLGWPDGPRGGAVVELAGAETLSDFAAFVADAATRMELADELLPGSLPGVPPVKEGTEGDPSRRTLRSTFAGWAATSRREEPKGGSATTWLTSLFGANDVLADSPDICARHPIFDAGPGTVSVSGTLAGARRTCLDPVAVAETFAGVAGRVAGSVGGYLDWRADRDAASMASRKDSGLRGDPVLTLLGLFAIGVAPVVIDTTARTSLAWGKGGRLAKSVVWPVWQDMLDIDAVTVMLAHPAIQGFRTASGAPATAGDGGRLRSLGVTAVYETRRIAKGNYDGAYGPPDLRWSADRSL